MKKLIILLAMTLPVNAHSTDCTKLFNDVAETIAYESNCGIEGSSLPKLFKLNVTSDCIAPDANALNNLIGEYALLFRAISADSDNYCQSKESKRIIGY